MKKFEYEFIIEENKYTGTAYGADSEEVEDEIKNNNPGAVNIDVWRIA